MEWEEINRGKETNVRLGKEEEGKANKKKREGKVRRKGILETMHEKERKKM